MPALFRDGDEGAEMIPCCAACRYFEPYDAGAKLGTCYRFPPVQLLARGVPKFPGVAASDWCGEFASLKP